MIWTTKKPTQPGWYWWDTVLFGVRFMKIVNVLEYDRQLFIVGFGDLADYQESKWSSEPIPEPQECR